MSAKMTRKDVQYLNRVNVATGYCDMQYLLRNHSKVGHNEGIYGWNYDVYSVYGVTICTGYRGMPGKWVQARDYEQRAKEASKEYGSEEGKRETERLLQEFCIKCGGTVETWERIERGK